MTTPPTEDRDWKSRLNAQFFGGVPIEDMGSNQVDEAKLQTFISQEITTAEARGRKEMLEKSVRKLHEMWNYPCSCYKRNKGCSHDFGLMESIINALSSENK